MKDFLLPPGVDVRASNQKISLRRLTDYVKEKYVNICCAIVFPRIIDLWYCRS